LLVCKENKALEKVDHVQVSCLDAAGTLKKEKSLQMLGWKFRPDLCCATGRFPSPWLGFRVVLLRKKTRNSDKPCSHCGCFPATTKICQNSQLLSASHHSLFIPPNPLPTSPMTLENCFSTHNSPLLATAPLSSFPVEPSTHSTQN